VDISGLWNSFLSKVKEQIAPMAYDTWFANTHLYELKDNKAIVLVPMHVFKKHLKENYNELIVETFTEVSGSNFTIDYTTQEELDNNISIDTNSLGVPTQDFESNLNFNYTFDNFVVGDANRFAHATSLVVAEKPGTMYNPLFIYANSGLGKTHLMHAIGNYIVKNSKKRVLYVTCEKFIADFINVNKRNKSDNNTDVVENFKRKYRDIDVLMIDDIQYLASANQTQQEFFNTFNDLYGNNKQIIISSDRSPDDLKLLEDRLRTRFNWGLLVDILPPDYNLRIDIINKKLKINGMDELFPTDVKEYIANNCVTDVRKIEGAITRVAAYATMMNGSLIDMKLAMEALKDNFLKNVAYKNKIDKVVQIVADQYMISPDDLKGKKRNTKVVIPRQVAMYICRIYLEESLPKIGMEFGGKDHTTVMHSVSKIEDELKKNYQLQLEIEKIIQKIN